MGDFNTTMLPKIHKEKRNMIYNILIGLIVVFTLINNYLKNKVIKRLEHDINILHTQKARHDLECPLLNTTRRIWMA